MTTINVSLISNRISEPIKRHDNGCNFYAIFAFYQRIEWYQAPPHPLSPNSSISISKALYEDLDFKASVLPSLSF
jgi:hypothetical protein